MCLCVCAHTCMSVHIHLCIRMKKGMSSPWELELQMVPGHEATSRSRSPPQTSENRRVFPQPHKPGHVQNLCPSRLGSQRPPSKMENLVRTWRQKADISVLGRWGQSDQGFQIQAGDVAQLMKHLAATQEALGSLSVTT